MSFASCFRSLVTRLFAAMVLVGLAAAPATAHFAWVVRGEDGRVVHVYFGERAEPDDPALLGPLAKGQLWRITPESADVVTIDSLKSKDELALQGKLPESDAGKSLEVYRHEYGIFKRGGAFLLRYYAKTGPAAGEEAWKIDCGKLVELDVLPEAADGEIRLRALWQGQPAADAQVFAEGPGLESIELKTDAAGRAAFKPVKPGLYSIRVRHIEERAGELNGEKYTAVRHYTTLALPIDAKDIPASAAPADSAPAEQNSPADDKGEKNEAPMAEKSSRFAAIPEPVTSFGAAVLDGSLYTYGGHTGEAHSYSDKEQANTLRRLDLTKPGKWQTVAEGPRLQGLALVAASGKLYRIGGFQAKNEKGKKHDLQSQAEVAAFDPQTNKWEALPPLPEARSSHDAAVLDGKIYVIGGWQLQGESDSTWHKTAWRLNPADKEPKWEALPAPPFQRRALAVAAHAGKLYAIGGMQPDGPTTRVDVFDPKTNEWTRGPDLDGKPMEGFGSAAFEQHGKLFVSTYEGRLQRLADDGKSWVVEQKLPTARFFHRMLPLGEHELVIVGGANMGSGKFDEVDVIEVK